MELSPSYDTLEFWRGKFLSETTIDHGTQVIEVTIVVLAVFPNTFSTFDNL